MVIVGVALILWRPEQPGASCSANTNAKSEAKIKSEIETD